MASIQAVDCAEYYEAMERTAQGQTRNYYPGAWLGPIPSRIEHLQTCAPTTIPIVDQLAAKIPSLSRNITWLTTSVGTHDFQYREGSAPWRTDCPACSVMADATKVFWQDEKLRARFYGWSGKHRLFNTQYPADDEHLQFFTKPGQRHLSSQVELVVF